MMHKTEYLSYTHGHILMSLCNRIRTNETNIEDVVRWIQEEQYNMRKKQSALWGIPFSEQCYYEYLSLINELLHTDDNQLNIEHVYGEIERKTRKKIHSLFLTMETSCWPSLRSVFEAADESDDYEAVLVYIPFYHANFTEQIDYYDEYLEMGLPVLRHNEYDLIQDSPDIVFILKPYSNIPKQYEYSQLECVIPRSVYIAYGMEITTDLAKYGYQYYAQYKAWRHSVYGNVVKEYSKRYGYRNGENVVVWGHPKADYFRDGEKQKDNIPEAWKKRIHGRKTILWTPHHLIDLNENGTGTWLIWGEQILKLVFKNPDIFFIIRPHPLLEGALVNSGMMSQKAFDRMRARIKQSDNILWDETTDYHNAFNASDAIITDGTTFSIEYLYTNKPILLTPRNMKGFYLYQQMLDCYYIARSIQDIEQFISMVREGSDPLLKKRTELRNNTFYIPKECTVGENIVNNVKKDLIYECEHFCSQGYSAVTPLNYDQQTKPDDGQEIEKADKSISFPLVSVLVVCYKNTNLLYGMLDTVFLQDYPRIELIISDDCSDDFEIDRVTSYVNHHRRHNIENVIVRKNEINMRTVRHIHDALELTTGEYVVFTAADDRFVGTDVLSRYVESFLSNPSAVWLVAQCEFTSADYKKKKYVSPTIKDAPFFEKEDSRLLFSRWSRRGMAIPCCMAFRKSAFELVGGIDLNYQFLEDWPLELKLLRAGYAPIYLPVTVALHSTGGVSNSNSRYGKEIRKAFYEDKKQLFKNEVEPYFDLLTPEDQKCYKQYQREIMARHYFINIDWPDTSKWQKIKLFYKNPTAIWWMFELWYVNHIKHFERKKGVIISQALVVFAVILFYFQASLPFQNLFRTVAIINLVLGLTLLIISILSYPLEKFFIYKTELRKKLVN